jgi:hypothetical protein
MVRVLKRYWVAVVLVALLIITGLVMGCSGCGARAMNSVWVRWVKVDNPQADNVSYEELQSFLQVYEYDIVIGSPCGDCARDLHNTAEYQGISAAIVIAQVGDGGHYHAFNAFATDKGIVYIDTTMGVCVKAQKVDDLFTFRWEHDGHITEQRVGGEDKFNVYW